MTINDAIEEYGKEAEAVGKRSTSWRSFARDLLTQVDGNVTVTNAAASSLARDWIARCRARKNAPATIHNKMGFFSALCRLANEAGHPAKFPRRLVGAIKIDNARTRTLSDKELAALRKEMHPDDWAVCVLAAKTGLRSQELFGLRVDDCDFADGMMEVRVTKTGRSRSIPMVGDVRALCSKAARGRREYVVNPRGFGEWASRRYMGEAWKTRVFRVALARAGIKNFRWHDWRHCATTNMVEAGADHVAVTAIMGWDSPKYLMRYANLRKKALTKAMSLA